MKDIEIECNDFYVCLVQIKYCGPCRNVCDVTETCEEFTAAAAQ